MKSMLQRSVEALARASREDLIAWLQDNDPNGCYTDELAAVEDLKPLTLEQARSMFLDCIKGE